MPETDVSAIRAELRRLTLAVHMGEATMADLGAYVGLHVDAIGDALRRTPPGGGRFETPDFDQIAQRLSTHIFEKCIDHWPEEGDFEDRDKAAGLIVAQFRLVWNARGAADRAALGVEFRRATDAGGGEIHPEEILKALDR